MRRLLILATLLATAATIFIVGRSNSGPVEVRGVGGHYSVTVTLDEPGARPATADIRVEPGSADAVWLSAVMPEMGHETPQVQASKQGPGRFVARGEFFPMAGVWELSMRVRGAAGEEVLTLNVLIPG